MAFSKFIHSMLEKKEIIINGNGEQTRDFTYITDIVGGNILAAKTEGIAGQVFNIGGGSRVTIKEIIRTLENTIGFRANIRFTNEQKGDVLHTFADIEKARKQLGYEPQVAIHEGLATQVEWTIAHRTMPT
jgi:UDP-glucose 4-epimerase